jgi:hypothetical protein
MTWQCACARWAGGMACWRASRLVLEQRPAGGISSATLGFRDPSEDTRSSRWRAPWRDRMPPAHSANPHCQA